jgi:hypothetical protein
MHKKTHQKKKKKKKHTHQNERSHTPPRQYMVRHHENNAQKSTEHEHTTRVAYRHRRAELSVARPHRTAGAGLMWPEWWRRASLAAITPPQAVQLGLPAAVFDARGCAGKRKLSSTPNRVN